MSSGILNKIKHDRIEQIINTRVIKEDDRKKMNKTAHSCSLFDDDTFPQMDQWIANIRKNIECSEINLKDIKSMRGSVTTCKERKTKHPYPPKKLKVPKANTQKPRPQSPPKAHATKIMASDVGVCKMKHVDRSVLAGKSLMVIGLMKNICKDIKYLKFFINELKTLFGKVSFYYLTNNNSDDTMKVMKEWNAEDPDVDGIEMHNETFSVIDSDGGIGNRVVMLAKYRNKLFQMATSVLGTEYDYMLQLDTDLISEITAEKFATCFELDEPFDAICANGVFRNSHYHYDVFALRLLDDPDLIQDVYPYFSLYYGLTYDWITKMHVFDKWTKVRSAWGGMMLFSRDVFALDKLYDESIPVNECEHVSLCRKLSNVYINPKLTYMQEYDTEGQCYSNPLLFIPRDAGFFSVFNFYIGMLTMCGRVYPYWNFKQFVRTNGDKPAHFCYFNEDNDNCWFDYFAKVKFFEGDNNHKTYYTSGAQSKFGITQGCEAPEEFRIPSVTKALLNNVDGSFDKWRKETHKIFTKYIQLSPQLDNIVNEISDDLFKPGVKMIGVHYRHPSHCCEQGIILLRDYFNQIDKILEEHPDAGIYLATDTDFGVVAFKQQYGDKVVYIEGIARTSLDNLLEWAYARGESKADGVGFINNKGYELQHVSSEQHPGGNPQLGMDVIVDVFCLAKCEWMVHTVSNLSLAVSYINPDTNMIKL
jgi:hypothetical protein